MPSRTHPYPERFRRQFDFWFRQKGLSQTEIAEILDIDPTTVFAWVHGRNFPSLWNLYRVCHEVWKIDLVTFFGRLPRAKTAKALAQ